MELYDISLFKKLFEKLSIPVRGNWSPFAKMTL